MYNDGARTLMQRAGIKLERNDKLPRGFQPGGKVDGVLYYVRGYEPTRNKRHRVMAICPTCGDVMSAARYPQHKNTATCLRRASK